MAARIQPQSKNGKMVSHKLRIDCINKLDALARVMNTTKTAVIENMIDVFYGELSAKERLEGAEFQPRDHGLP